MKRRIATLIASVLLATGAGVAIAAEVDARPRHVCTITQVRMEVPSWGGSFVRVADCEGRDGKVVARIWEPAPACREIGARVYRSGWEWVCRSAR